MIAGSDNHTPKRRRRTPRVVGLLAVLLVAVVSAVGASGRHVEVDINSGREERTLTVGPFTLVRDVYETPFSRLVESSRLPLAAPEWRRAFTTWCPSGARINYSYGGMVTAARELLSAIELLDAAMPAPDRHRLAGTAMRCMQRGDAFLVRVNAEASTVELLASDHRVLESFPAAIDSQP